ncbi:unnamed protein product [Discula destructiva]
MKDFEPLLSRASTPVPPRRPCLQSFIFKESFTLPTLLALGSLIQTLISALLPSRYALLPLAFVLGRAIVKSVLSRTSTSNPLLADIIPGRATAQLPVPGASGAPSFGQAPAASSVVAFHLGVHINHPLGLLAPGASAIGAHFQAMTDALIADRANAASVGLISTSTWQGTERASGNAILMVAYFRDVQGLSRFAHGEVHRAGWDWYNRFVRETGLRHFGIFHETFMARPGEWETIYADCAPTLLGAGSVKIGGGEGEEQRDKGEESWISPLVSSDHPALKTQAKRMGLMPGLKDGVSE